MVVTGVSATAILLMRDGLKMIWIAARPVPAKVIDFFSFWNWTDIGLKYNSVRKSHFAIV
ncbi:hypothetical protein PVV74_11595 [Roseovarius sp. SK2]|nr:hypothetical protein [Roseovarius sp. SK2]MDD9726100.1 hypothetical protein [Roseovarius sp. SK2]